VRSFRLVLALAATVSSLALAGAGAYADDDCPGRNTDLSALEPYVCAGVGQDGWGGPVIVYAGTCATHDDGTCDLVVVPAEELVVRVAGTVGDVLDDIRP
jgi:hypothetical protein